VEDKVRPEMELGRGRSTPQFGGSTEQDSGGGVGVERGAASLTFGAVFALVGLNLFEPSPTSRARPQT
jgi:hypothetical protein